MGNVDWVRQWKYGQGREIMERREFLQKGLVLGAGLIPGMGVASELLGSYFEDTTDSLLSRVVTESKNHVIIEYFPGNSEGIMIECKESAEPGIPIVIKVYLRTDGNNGATTKIVTTAPELVTALNNSAYWGMSMCHELLGQLAKYNAENLFFDIDWPLPPVIMARLA